MPRIQTEPATPAPGVYKGAAVAEWNWRIVAMSGVFCIVLLFAAGILAIFGERDGLYLAYAGIVSFIVSILTVTIDWIMRKP